jgi:hypothetical protein
MTEAATMALFDRVDAFYGRDFGYAVERLVLDEETEAISASLRLDRGVIMDFSIMVHAAAVIGIQFARRGERATRPTRSASAARF